MTEPLVQTSKDTLPTVRREPWEPVLVQVFRDADTGDRIRPAGLLTRSLWESKCLWESWPGGKQAVQMSVGRPKCDPGTGKGRE